MTMRTRILLLLLCFACAAPAARAQNEDFTITRWHGGILEADFRYGVDLLTGGTGPATMGGVFSPRVTGGATSLFSNPAELGLLQHQQIVFGTKLNLGTNTFGLDGDALITPDQIAQETDDVLTDFNYPGTRAPQYTRMGNLGARQVGRLAGFSFALPVHKRLILALGTHYPLDVSLDMRYSGMETFLEASQEAGDQTINVGFFLRFGLAAQMRLNMNTLSLGAGSHLLEGRFGHLYTGFSLNRYSVTNALRLDASPDGVVVLNRTTEYYFNDPQDPTLDNRLGETNELSWHARGNFQDAAWGFRAGLHYQPPTSAINFSVVYNHMPSFSLEDENAYSRSYLPSFINLKGKTDPGPDEEEMVDIAALDIAKPALTMQSSDSLGQQVHLSLPSSLTFGVDLGLGAHTLALNYVHYMGDFSYGYTYKDDYLLGKAAQHGIRAGMDFQFPDRLKGAAWALVPVRLLFLDIDGLLLQAFGKYTGYSDPHYRIGGSVMLGQGLAEGFEESDDLRSAMDLPLPASFSLGRKYTLLDRVDVGVMLFGIPDMAFRVGLGYTFR